MAGRFVTYPFRPASWRVDQLSRRRVDPHHGIERELGRVAVALEVEGHRLSDGRIHVDDRVLGTVSGASRATVDVAVALNVNLHVAQLGGGHGGVALAELAYGRTEPFSGGSPALVRRLKGGVRIGRRLAARLSGRQVGQIMSDGQSHANLLLKMTKASPGGESHGGGGEGESGGQVSGGNYRYGRGRARRAWPSY